MKNKVKKRNIYIPDLSKADSGQDGPNAKSTRSPWRIQNRRIKPGFDVDDKGSNRPFYIKINGKNKD